MASSEQCVWSGVRRSTWTLLDMKAAVGCVNAVSRKETRRGLRKTLMAEEWFCRVGILLSDVSVVRQFGLVG